LIIWWLLVVAVVAAVGAAQAALVGIGLQLAFQFLLVLRLL